MPRTNDRVKETSSTTSTGNFTLAGAVSQFQSFQSAFGTTSVFVQYTIAGQTGTQWEVGYGTFDGTSTLTRDKVYQSSNSNALVDFSAGTKDVFATFTGNAANDAGYGHGIMQAAGFALP